MIAAELKLWTRLTRRAASVTPELAMLMLAAFATVRDSMSESELARAIDLGFIDRIFDEILTQAVLSSAFMPVRDRLRVQIVQAVKYIARDLPSPPAGKTLTVAFDFLNPRVVDAVRTMETRVLGALEADIKAVVRATAERGLADGLGSRVIARELRTVVGLGPSQLQQVQNFRDALSGLNGRSLADYTLRDKRLDAMLRNGPLTPEQIERYTARYASRRIAQNAATVARTAAMDAQRLGQRLSWIDAADRGIVNRDRLMKQRIGVADDRERPEHLAINNEVRPFDEPYSNGEMVCGDLSWSCRCIDRYSQSAA